MKPTTREWISKAEDDFHVAQMSYRARKHPSYDASAFHSQQCAEKYFKARLEEGGVTLVRTHDLLVLHQNVLVVEPTWVVFQPFFGFPESLLRCVPISRHHRNQARCQGCTEELS